GFRQLHSGRSRDHSQLYASGARAEHSDIAGRGPRQINDAPTHERTSIVDANADASSIGEVGDLHPSLKGKTAVRGGELLHVVDLTGGRAAAMIKDSIPTCDAGLGVSYTCRCGCAWDAR